MIREAIGPWLDEMRRITTLSIRPLRRSSPTSRLLVVVMLGFLVVSLPGWAWAQEEPPDVVGVQVDQAIAILEEAGFEVEVVSPAAEADPDLVVVILQESFPEDRFVRVFLGTLVPDLIGTTGDQADAVVSSHGLSLSIDGEETGESQVVEQSPSPGELVEFGTAVEARLEMGGGFPWIWIVVIVVVIACVPIIRRTRRSQPRSRKEPDDRPEDTEPHDIEAKAHLGRPCLRVDDPSEGASDHAVRVELVVGAVHQFEEAN